jgi:hypothetical protein
MLESVIIDFENITKYPLVSFMERFQDFSSRSYPHIDRYFSGKTENIDNEHLMSLQWLTDEIKTLNAQFKNFSNRFEICGYWELMEFIENLNDLIERTNKLPKFRRTVLTKRGYKPYVQMDGTIGSFRTAEDVTSNIINFDDQNSAWQNLMRDNDMDEGDWEIDELKPITTYVDNRINVVVTTILDQPVGERVYGIDIARKIKFDSLNNDLNLVVYRNNINQKIDILLELNKGDVPEDNQFGKDLSHAVGSNASQIGYLLLARDIVSTFMQNDLFDYVSVVSMEQQEDSLQVRLNIKTKYDSSTVIIKNI